MIYQDEHTLGYEVSRWAYPRVWGIIRGVCEFIKVTRGIKLSVFMMNIPWGIKVPGCCPRGMFNMMVTWLIMVCWPSEFFLLSSIMVTRCIRVWMFMLNIPRVCCKWYLRMIVHDEHTLRYRVVCYLWVAEYVGKTET
jgi:hypothetical protein